jgi:uncharacterized protein (TIGR00369 family)
MPRISREDMEEICRQALPWVELLGFEIEEIGRGTARVVMPESTTFLRPGGTVSGPALMSLADYGLYVAVLSVIGRVELAVTTNLTCNFLRRPPPGAVVAECRMIKVGRRLAYGEVLLTSRGQADGDPVAHVTATYSIPPQDGRPTD